MTDFKSNSIGLENNNLNININNNNINSYKANNKDFTNETNDAATMMNMNNNNNNNNNIGGSIETNSKLIDLTNELIRIDGGGCGVGVGLGDSGGSLTLSPPATPILNANNQTNNKSDQFVYADETINNVVNSALMTMTNEDIFINLKSFSSNIQENNNNNSSGTNTNYDQDNLIKTVKLNSLNSLIQPQQPHQQQQQNSQNQSDNSNNSNNKQQPSKQQLSRNSSTFSTKSHYSMRSTSNRAGSANTGGGCGSASGAGGGVSSTGGSIKLNKRISNQQQQQQLIQPTIVPLPTTAIITSTTNSNNNHHHRQTNNLLDSSSIDSSSNASIYSLNRANTSLNNNNNNNNNISSLNNNNNNSDGLSNIINLNMRDPILIRGAGNITIFGVCNKFNEQFPSQLTAKLAPEEFRDTIKQINNILNKELANSFKWLVFGSIFCCCTLGCSFLPVIFMNKKAKLSINKLLDLENQRLYLKLGLKWRLTKMKCNSNSLLEYVLLIEFLPTLLLYQPD